MKQWLPAVLLATLTLASCTQRPDGVAVTRYTDDTVQSSLGRHTVHAGETVWTIAQAYHVEVRDVLDANALSAPFIVPAGTRMVIPAPREYKIKKGDTIFRVSRMFGTTTTKLAYMNNIKPPYKLASGQVLKLPVFSNQMDGMPQKESAPPKVAISQIIPVQKAPLETWSRPQKILPNPAIVPTVFVPQERGVGAGGKLRFINPVQGKIITQFGPTQDGLHNDGINIKAPKGAGVKATERGQVVYVGNHIEGYGHMVLIKHSGGYVSAYAHLEKALVKKGDTVVRGQTIGTVGSTGHVSAPQLHFEIRKGRDALDPQRIMSGQV